MKKFLRFLLICSSCFLLLGSCSPVKKGYTRQTPPEFEFTPVYGETFEKALYEVDISFGKKSISGVAVIRKMRENNSIRTVFMSETGLTYFDFEFFENDSSKVHYVMDALNKKGLVRIFTTDLGILMKTRIVKEDITCYRSKQSPEVHVVKEKQKGRNYYKFDEINKPPVHIFRRAFFSPATDLIIKYTSGNLPSDIIFTHTIINLKMELKLITE